MITSNGLADGHHENDETANSTAETPLEDGQVSIVRELADLDQQATFLQICKLLGDGTRLGVMSKLRKGEKNVTNICRDLKMPQPAVSHHLALMRHGRVLDARRDGKFNFYDVTSHGEDGYTRAILFLAELGGYRIDECAPTETNGDAASQVKAASTVEIPSDVDPVQLAPTAPAPSHFSGSSDEVAGEQNA